MVTQYALSNRTAIGIQTGLLTKQFSHWNHFYWEPEKALATVPNSHRLENGLLLVWRFTAGRGFFRRSINRFGLSWWRNNRLRPRHRKYVSAIARDSDFCYLAPLDERDASRCRDIVGVVDRPFVIHLWDNLDGSLQDGSSDLRWLVQQAEHVFCVSKPLLDEVVQLNPRVGYLLFQRPASSHFAIPPNGITPFRIALIGHVNSYRDGLALLMGAVQRLRRDGVDTEVIYVGQEEALQFLPPSLREPIVYIGFLNDDRRDATLASCHAGFMPGPLQPPQTDGRSRYSIPSRLLDFSAVGLPVIATAHPASATASFLQPVAGKGAFLVRQEAEICALVRALMEPGRWREASDWSLAFFGEELASSDRNQKLADYFNDRARSADP